MEGLIDSESSKMAPGLGTNKDTRGKPKNQLLKMTGLLKREEKKKRVDYRWRDGPIWDPADLSHQVISTTGVVQSGGMLYRLLERCMDAGSASRGRRG